MRIFNKMKVKGMKSLHTYTTEQSFLSELTGSKASQEIPRIL